LAHRVPVVFYYISYTLLIVSFVSTIPGIYGLIYGDYDIATLFTTYGLLIALLSRIMMVKLEPSGRLRLEDAMIIAALSWILIPLLSAIPAYMSLGIPFPDAWFEATSGFTTTGLTIFSGSIDPAFNTYIPDVESLPHAILLWRSILQWIGGIGILVVISAFIIGGTLPSHLLAFAEARYERILPSMRRSMQVFVEIYLVLTLVSTILFWLSGMPLFDSVNHAMTGLATGGFSVKNKSFAAYNSVPIEIAAILVMSFGAANFADHYRILRGRLNAIKESMELRAYLTVIGISSLLVIIVLVENKWLIDEATRKTVFQVVSAVSGTGFQTMDLSRAPEDSKFILSIIMLIGGSVLSTTGGFKLYRLLVLTSIVKWSTREVEKVHGIVVVRKIGRNTVSCEDCLKAIAVIGAYFATWIISSIIAAVLDPNAPFIDVVFETASALGNVGLSTGVLSASSPLSLKLLYIVLMTLGRLEILTYMAVLVALREKRVFKK